MELKVETPVHDQSPGYYYYYYYYYYYWINPITIFMDDQFRNLFCKHCPVDSALKTCISQGQNNRNYIKMKTLMEHNLRLAGYARAINPDPHRSSRSRLTCQNASLRED